MKCVLTLLLFLVGPISKAQQNDSIRFHLHQYRIGYSLDFFDDELSSWNTLTVGSDFTVGKWTVLSRVNFSRRFDQNGIYAEVDGYRKFKNDDYMLLEAGVSPQNFFPHVKVGVEYYNPFGKWEHSIGLKHYNFEQTGDLILLTKSLSRYYGRHLSILRLNGAWALDGGDFSNYAVLVQHRYYRKDDSYIGVFGSYGFDTSLIILNEGLQNTGTDPYLISAGLNYQTSRVNRHQWSFSYVWTFYDFVIHNRTQHTLSFIYLLKQKGHETY